MKNVAILLSGRGSNFMSLSDAVEAGEIPARIVLVFSNKNDAAGLAEARRRGYATASIVPQKGQSREDYDRLVVDELEKAQTDIICLAGYMRIVSAYFVSRFPQRILNIHPSLLPAFPGLRAQRQALEWGAKVSGCTVHFVDERLDHGPAILQQAVPVKEDDDEDTLSARILIEEHRIYPQALQLLCQDRLQIRGRRVHIAPE
ncbi:MAG TPA: phosphoribosylglycinamide formyltransferase [Acidobacteriota bacterium]|nr:phosphoribosylglycinamide formyltransferase [Acidobacteriota bacterium]